MEIPVKKEKVKKMMRYIKDGPNDLTPEEAKGVVLFYLANLCDIGIDMLIDKEEAAKLNREGERDEKGEQEKDIHST